MSAMGGKQTLACRDIASLKGPSNLRHEFACLPCLRGPLVNLLNLAADLIAGAAKAAKSSDGRIASA